MHISLFSIFATVETWRNAIINDCLRLWCSNNHNLLIMGGKFSFPVEESHRPSLVTKWVYANLSTRVRNTWQCAASIVLWSSGDVVVKFLACVARGPGSIPGLAVTISEIGHRLLPSRDMAEISLKRHKSSKTNQNSHVLTLSFVIISIFLELMLTLEY